MKTVAKINTSFNSLTAVRRVATLTF